MKALALFSLILMSASSFAIDGAGMPVGPGAPTQISRPDYFIKANAHKVKCMAGYTPGHVSMTEFSLSIEGGPTISVSSVKNNAIENLYKQCEAAKYQAIQDSTVATVIINIDTGEVFPAAGFFHKRDSAVFERQNNIKNQGSILLEL